MSHFFITTIGLISPIGPMRPMGLIYLVQIPSARTRDRIALLVKVHSKIETHSMKEVLDLRKRLLAEVLRAEHVFFAAFDQITDRANVGVLQAIVRSNRKFELIDRLI